MPCGKSSRFSCAGISTWVGRGYDMASQVQTPIPVDLMNHRSNEQASIAWRCQLIFHQPAAWSVILRKETKIIACWECNLPITDIATAVGEPWGTMSSFLKRYQHDNSPDGLISVVTPPTHLVSTCLVELQTPPL